MLNLTQEEMAACYCHIHLSHNNKCQSCEISNLCSQFDTEDMPKVKYKLLEAFKKELLYELKGF